MDSTWTRDDAVADLTGRGRSAEDAARLFDGLIGREHPSIPRQAFTARSAHRYIEDFGLLDSRMRFGWVDRDGRWFGCAYAAHERLLYALGMSTAEAESQGWARAGIGPPKCRFLMSPKQRRVLRAKDHTVDPTAELAKPKFGEDASLSDYATHASAHEDGFGAP